jgi:hypothetical protein
VKPAVVRARDRAHERVLLDANARLDLGAAGFAREREHRGDRRRVVVDQQPDAVDEALRGLGKRGADRDRNDRGVFRPRRRLERDDALRRFDLRAAEEIGVHLLPDRACVGIRRLRAGCRRRKCGECNGEQQSRPVPAQHALPAGAHARVASAPCPSRHYRPIGFHSHSSSA